MKKINHFTQTEDEGIRFLELLPLPPKEIQFVDKRVLDLIWISTLITFRRRPSNKNKLKTLIGTR